jgi:ADP-glucose pyrophosphorylase
MTDAVIEENAVVDHVIVDKRVRVGTGTRIGRKDDHSPNTQTGSYNGITVIGKNTLIPAHTRIGTDCTIAADLGENIFEKHVIPSGTSIGIADE